jgi:uncharacterized protein YbcV (DUF1398 family)
MFAVDQIKSAHSKVKSGADFPAYIGDLRSLGVRYYDAYVSDGRTDYFGEGDFKASAPAKYTPMEVAETPNIDKFTSDLKAHQQGKTDYLAFCADCARSGIEKWQVCLDKMTCTYYDKTGGEILVEAIPQ